MRWRRCGAGGALALLACTSTTASVPERGPLERSPRDYGYALDGTLRLNHLQAKATHNSYHVETPGLSVGAWRYTHAPLDVQLGAQGVRAFELDTRLEAGSDRFEVYHLLLLDERTTCRVFVECLSVIKSWSDRFPAHQPLSIMIEPKDATPAPAEAEAYFARLEGEIRSVWPRERILTPDDVQGSALTLREAVTTRGWPTLGQLRGAVFFFVNDTTDWRSLYTRGGTSLRGRSLFVQGLSREDPLAAVFIQNSPAQPPDIAALVREGFLVRTVADAADARVPEVREAALASGAQIVSTDFAAPVPVPGGSYVFDLPGGEPSRCSPIVAPPECTSAAIEDPSKLLP